MNRCLLAVTLLCVAVPDASWAHAFGQRYDLPLPLGYYLAGAGLTVALTFLGSALFLRVEKHMRSSIGIHVPYQVTRFAAPLFRMLAVLSLTLILTVALFGPASPTQNLATIFIWVIWWVGFVLLSALVVDLWSSLNPFATVIDAALLRFEPRKRRPLSPVWVGWLAVFGLIFLSWIELVSDWSENPRAMALIVLLYTLGLFLGSFWLGRSAWFQTADPLTLLFGLLGLLLGIHYPNVCTFLVGVKRSVRRPHIMLSWGRSST